jgi:7,8-dihydroneopterin aldolase/epimerase/oxygenase
MDIVFLRELKLKTLIGVLPWERQAPQTVQFDLEIGLPTSLPCVTDNVADTIDYSRVVKRIKEALAERRFALAEALAEHVAQLLLQEFNSPWVRVSVTKLGLMNEAKQLGVVIERSARVSH